MTIAGQWAIRFSPHWKLNTNMRSNLDPNSNFLTNVPLNYIEPLDPNILTQPVWINVFLTPGLFGTRTPGPTTVAVNTPVTTNTPVATNTIVTPVVASPTSTVPSPTNTIPYFPPPTNTPRPPNTRTPTPTPVQVDLTITKTDGAATYTAGSSTTYTIVVTNAGSNGVTGATVTDTFPSVITASWTCAATGGATCTASSSGNISDTVNVPVGGTLTYTVTANISPSATGNLVNTASVTVPSGYNDTNGANDSATDTDTQYIPTVNLQITKTDNPASATYTPGSPITYTIVVSNTGPDTVFSATVTDTFPAEITSAT